MNKKLVAVVCAVNMIASLMPAAIHAESAFTLEGVTNSGTNVTLDFSNNLSTDAKNGIEIVDADGNMVTGITYNIADDKLIAELPGSTAGGTYTLNIKNSIKDSTGIALDDGYTGEFTVSGFYEDFGDGYTEGDWKKSTADDSNTVIEELDAPVSDGILTMDSGIRNFAFMHKNDYKSYKYSNSDLEFDYMLDANDETNDANTMFVTLTKLTGEDAWFNTSGATKGYATGFNYNHGAVLNRKKTAADSGLTWRGLDNVSGASPLNDSRYNTTVGVKFRLKFETRTNGTEVKTTFYKAKYGADGALPEYTKVFELTDSTDAYTESGTFALFVQKGIFEVDNVKYVNTDSATVTLGKASDMHDEILAELQEIESAEDQSQYVDELVEIKVKIEGLEVIAADIVSDLWEIYDRMVKFTLQSVSITGTTLNFDFNNNIATNAADGIVIVGADGEKITGIKYSVADDMLTAELPDNLVGETLSLNIKNTIEDSIGTKLDNGYTGSFKVDGFYEDFGEGYTEGDWKKSTADSSNAKIEILDATVNNGVLVMDSAIRNFAFMHKNDYKSYKYLNTDLEFDYMLKTQDETSDANTMFVALTKLTGEDAWFNTSGATKGYATGFNYNHGAVLNRKKTAADSGLGWRGLDNVSGASPLNDSRYNTTVGVNFRLKFETRTNGTEVKTTFYKAKYGADGVLPEYTKVFELTDSTDAYTEAGTFAFYVQKGIFEIDNVIYKNVDSKKITLENARTMYNEILAELQTIQNEIDWSVYAEELAVIKTKIESLEVIIPDDVADLWKLYNKLVDGRDESDMVDLISADAIARLKTKYEATGHITVAGLGGSLTEGGTPWGIALCEYIAEEIGLNVAENDIQVIMTDSKDTVNKLKKITYVNAGNGGSTSDWHNTRLNDDVIKYNPDLILLDFSVNDDDYVYGINGKSKTVVATETAIRRLMNLENDPIIAMIYIPTNEKIKLAHLDNLGITNQLTDTNGVLGFDSFKRSKSSDNLYITSTPYQVEIAEYYGISNIDITSSFVKHSSLNLTEEQYGYYTKNDNGDVVECDENDYGATKVLKPGVLSTLIPEIDYNSLFEEYGIDESEFLPYYPTDADRNNALNRHKVPEGMDIMDTFLRISPDWVHGSIGGYGIYGEILKKLCATDADAAIRLNPEETPEQLEKPIYDKFSPKRVEFTVDNINNLAEISEGANVEEATFKSNIMRTRTGVKLTGPMTLTYRFSGNVFKAEGTLASLNGDSSVNATMYSDGLHTGIATLDGLAYKEKDNYYLFNNMLDDSDEHELIITLGEGESYYLYAFYVDEELTNREGLGADKYVTVDLSDYATVYGAKKITDGKVFSKEYQVSEEGRVSYNNLTPALKEIYRPDIYLDYKEDYYVLSSIDAEDVKKNIDSNIPYDLSIFDNTRYRGVSAASYLNGVKRGFRGTVDCINDRVTIDVPDDYYENINLLISSVVAYSGDNQAKIIFNYEDGTTTEVPFDVYMSNGTLTDISSVSGVTSVYEGYKLHNVTGVVTTDKAALYQYTLPVSDNTKQLDSISIYSDNANLGQRYIIYGLTLKTMYDAGILDVEIRNSTGKVIYDITDALGQQVDVKYTLAGNSTDAIDAKAYIAIYSGDKLINATSADVRFDNTAYKYVVIDTIDIPESVDGELSIKSYLWQGTSNMPLTLPLVK